MVNYLMVALWRFVWNRMYLLHEQIPKGRGFLDFSFEAAGPNYSF